MDLRPDVAILLPRVRASLPAATADQILASRALPTLARSPAAVMAGTFPVRCQMPS